MVVVTCDSTWIGGFDVALSCVREAGHPMPHRNDIGTTWDDQPAPSASGEERS